MHFGGGRMVEVGGRLEVACQHLERSVECDGARRLLGKHRNRAGTEESNALAGSVGDPGKADDSVVAVAPRELEEHRALDLWHLDAGEDLAWPDIGFKQPLKEMRG